MDHVSLATLNAVYVDNIKYEIPIKPFGTKGSCYSYELDARTVKEKHKTQIKY